MNSGHKLLSRRLGLNLLPYWVAGLLLLTGCGQAQTPATSVGVRTAPQIHPSDVLFSGPILAFEVTIAPGELDSLRREPRKSVPATIRVGSNVWERVGVRVKGAAGSTRSIDDNPALTLNVDKFKPGQKIMGLDKLHLNNSVQDPSRMSEIVCSDLYRRAGIPACRATQALMKLNGRDLGLYVLKEGFDKSFLHRQFTDSSGNLYDGGFLRDIDQQLELDAGKQPPDWKDLQALFAACQIPDAALRKAALGRWVDVERFVTYTALQVMTEDWDGYPCNRNNYRVYHDPARDRFVFMPHGMDQMFNQGGMPLNRGFEGMVAARILQTPEWRSAYFERIEMLLTNVFSTNAILKVFDEVVARREPALVRLSRGDAEGIRSSTRELRHNIIQRVANVTEQMARRPRPTKMAADGRIPLGKWQPGTRDGDSGAERVRDDKNTVDLFRLTLKSPGQASWRSRVQLPAGSYRFEGRARTLDLVSTPNARAEGLGLRISGSTRKNQLKGTTDWQLLTFEFSVEEDSEVELVAEIRGAKGTGWFDPSSFRVSKLP